MYKNTISFAFKRVNTIEEAVNTVENFYSLAKLPKIKNYIKNDIALEVIFLYTNEIEQMRAKNDAKSFVRLFKQTTESIRTSERKRNPDGEEVRGCSGTCAERSGSFRPRASGL